MNRLCIDGHEAGSERSTWLLEEGNVVALEEQGLPEGERLWPLPARALDGAFGRYARPLDERYAPPTPAEDDAAIRFVLPTGERALVRSFSFLDFGAVEPTHYLLYEVEGREPQAAPAPLMSAALLVLGRAAAGQAHSAAKGSGDAT